MAKSYTLSEQAAKRTAKAVRRVLDTPIVGVRKREGKKVINTAPYFQRFVRITGSTPIGSNRWRYSGILSSHNGVGEFAEFTPIPENTLAEIYNSMEANNDNSGVQGNGVNVSTLPAGFSIQPLATDTVVPIWVAGFYPNWNGIVSAPNAVDGVCPP